MENITANNIKHPEGLLLLGFRLPVWIYRLGLGRFMGKRMIYFEHVGRISGITRRSVVEVVRYDSGQNTYIVISGYGERADWFQNLMKNPIVKAQVGGTRFSAVTERLSQEKALEEFLDYARRFPNNLKYLGRLIGLQLEGTKEELVQLSRILPVITLKPEQKSREQ